MTQLYFFALGYMQSWEAVATIIGACFWNGGPRAMVWGFFPVMFGVMCQVASLAEASSLVPLAGAQYVRPPLRPDGEFADGSIDMQHWSWLFAPPSSTCILSSTALDRS